MPNRYRDLAVHTARFHSHCHRAMKLQPKTILEMLETIDAFRRPDRFDNFLAACKADARGRKGLEDQPYPQATLLSEARTAAAAVNTLSLHDKNLKGPAVGEAIRRARIDAIKKVKAGFAD